MDDQQFLHGLIIDFLFPNDGDSFIEVTKDSTGGTSARPETMRLSMTNSIVSLLDQLGTPALGFMFGVIIGLIGSFVND